MSRCSFRSDNVLPCPNKLTAANERLQLVDKEVDPSPFAFIRKATIIHQQPTALPSRVNVFPAVRGAIGSSPVSKSLPRSKSSTAKSLSASKSSVSKSKKIDQDPADDTLPSNFVNSPTSSSKKSKSKEISKEDPSVNDVPTLLGSDSHTTTDRNFLDSYAYGG